MGAWLAEVRDMFTYCESRRGFLMSAVGVAVGGSLARAAEGRRWDVVSRVLEDAVKSGLVRSASMHVEVHGSGRPEIYSLAVGAGASVKDMYLLGSISKPIVITGLMSLFDRGAFRLEDCVSKFVPEFRGEGREEVTMQQVLTHVSGLPDQLANNADMRKAHAPLSEFVQGAARTALQFKPGTRYEYSSMGILLASRVAEVISGEEIRAFTERVVMGPLGMTRSAQGLGRFQAKDFVPMQIEFAAPEAGGGDPASISWNWNSAYWRALGAPWGGTHASAADVAKWLGEFLLEQGRVIRPETARLMASNRNRAGLESRGLALDVGESLAGRGASERVFGHTGSTGTIAWADPVKRVICVVLTSLPARAVQPHPRDQAAEAVAGLLG